MQKNNTADILIIGGGAAGLFAAQAAAESGARVTVLEKNAKPGAKLLLTGKGRCNVTNFCNKQVFFENIASDSRFLHSAFDSFPPEAAVEFFESLGVPMKTERGNRVFPQSDRAADVAGALFAACKSRGVGFLHAKASSLDVAADNVGARYIKGVVTADGKKICTPAVIMATGGLSYPKTGSTGDGFAMAQAVGHKVAELRPSLVPIEVFEPDAAEMQGLSLRNVKIRLFCDEKEIFSDFGEMVFTHFGVSGPIILSMSAHIRNNPERYRFSIDLKPALTPETVDRRLIREFSAAPNKSAGNVMKLLLPERCALAVLRRCGIEPDCAVNSVTASERAELVRNLKNLSWRVSSLRPFSEAIITAGGVSTREINPKTMESKLVGGLFFAGEVIDADAYTGGFNLHIAWCTAYAAARSAAAKFNQNI